MSGSKAVVVWVCAVVVLAALTLSGGVGVGVSAAAGNADLQVVDADLAEETIAEGEPATVTATVENLGNQTGTLTTELEIEDGVVDTTEVEVEPGETRDVEFTEPFDTTGTYEIAVSGESAGTLTVTEPAAFEVSSVRLDDDTVLAGDTAVVSAEVTNVGGDEGTFTAGFRATSRDGTTETVDTRSVTLAAGESQAVELRGTFEEPGEYGVQVNRTGNATLTVESPADLAVTDAALEETVVSEDGEVAVNATIENTGDREGDLSVAVAADGAEKATGEFAVAPGERRTERLTYTATADGEYDVTVNGVAAGTLTVIQPATFRTTNAEVEPATVLTGESTEVTATIVNVGTQSGTHTATLVADGESVESKELVVGPGDSERVEFSPAFETAAEYAIAVDDEPAGTLSVLEPANVSIRDTTLSPERITTGESATVTVELVNDGDVDGEFTTRLRNGNDTLETATRTVGPNANETVRFDRTFETAGDYDLAVNNDSVGTLAVLEPADVSLGETTLAPESVEVNESVELTVELRNAGEATGQRDVDVALGDGTALQRTTDVPENGTTLTISHGYNATGEYEVTVDDATVANVTVVEPQDDSGSGGGGGSSGFSGGSGSSGSTGGGGASGSSESSDSSNSSGSSGSTATSGEEPTVVRSESDEAVTVGVEGATDGGYETAVDLAGPSSSRPAVSVSSVAVEPAGDRTAFETTIGGPTAEPDGRDPVPHGTALGYVAFDSTLDAANTTSATLRFAVDEEAIPGGLGPEHVAVFRYADGAWTTANATHDVEGDTHTVTLPNAMPVAVVALEPGRVDVVESAVLAEQVRVGYETTLRATVENPGDRAATRNLTASMNGETVAEREVTLEPGGNATVQIRFEPRESGTVSLEGNEVGTITLFGDDDGTTPTDAETDEDAPGFGVIAAMLALLVTALGVRVRRP